MNATQEIVVVGSGGMARRYIVNLLKLFPDSNINCLPLSNNSSINSFSGINKVISSIQEAVDMDPTSAIIASPSTSHLSYATEFIKNNIPVLIEKPLTTSVTEIEKFEDILKEKKELIEVAYCLRFLPAAKNLKAILEDEETLGGINSVVVEVGQYLPDWRPEIDYRHSVSANKSLGGGVLSELSHELDYLNWFFGPFSTVFCDLENTKTLEIDVEDRVDAIFRNKNITVNLHMDFLQRHPSRTCKIIGTKGNLIWDILKNSLLIEGSDGKKEIIFDDPEYDRNNMYLEMISRFYAVCQKKLKPMIDIEQSSYVVSLIAAMRLSSESQGLVEIPDSLL